MPGKNEYEVLAEGLDPPARFAAFLPGSESGFYNKAGNGQGSQGLLF